MSYRLIKEHPAHFELLHPDGSKFHIAKAHIGPVVENKIKGLPKFADGGEVEEADKLDITPSEDQPQEPDQPASQKPLEIEPDETQRAQASNPLVIEPSKEEPQAQSGAMPDANLSMVNPQLGINGIFQGQAEANKATMEAAKAQSAGAMAQSKVLEQQNEQMKNAMNRYENQKAAIDIENKKLTQDVMSQKIDPNHFWADKSTGSKIGAAIAIALGGIGSGMTGQPNMALKVIDDAIGRDIDTQKAELGKKETMLSMNYRKYGDLNTAAQMTMLQMNHMVQGQIQSIAARTNSATAIQQGKIAVADREMKMVPITMELAKNMAMAQSLGGPQGQGGLEVGREPMSLLGDKGYRENRVVVRDKAYQASSPKDAEELRTLTAGYEPVKQKLMELNNLGPKAVFPGTPENLKAIAIKAYLVPRLNKMHGLNRLSEEDVKLMKEQISDPTKITGLINGGVVNTQFMKNLQEDLESNYKEKLIGYSGPNDIKSFQPVK